MELLDRSGLLETTVSKVFRDCKDSLVRLVIKGPQANRGPLESQALVLQVHLVIQGSQVNEVHLVVPEIRASQVSLEPTASLDRVSLALKARQDRPGCKVWLESLANQVTRPQDSLVPEVLRESPEQRASKGQPDHLPHQNQALQG